MISSFNVPLLFKNKRENNVYCSKWLRHYWTNVTAIHVFTEQLEKNSLVIRTRQTAKLINKFIFRWGTHLYMSLFPSVCPFFRLSVRGTPHLRNRTFDHNFWYTYIFIFFKMLIFWIVRQVKGQKMVQHEKKCLSHSISQEPFIIWLSFVVHKCKMIISLGLCFIFSKFWFFRLVMG